LVGDQRHRALALAAAANHPATVAGGVVDEGGPELVVPAVGQLVGFHARAPAGLGQRVPLLGAVGAGERQAGRVQQLDALAAVVEAPGEDDVVARRLGDEGVADRLAFGVEAAGRGLVAEAVDGGLAQVGAVRALHRVPPLAAVRARGVPDGAVDVLGPGLVVDEVEQAVAAPGVLVEEAVAGVYLRHLGAAAADAAGGAVAGAPIQHAARGRCRLGGVGGTQEVHRQG